MMGESHRTLAREIVVSGVGVHTGRSVEATLIPKDTPGIEFLREDVAGAEPIPADLAHVLTTDMGTALGLSEENQVLTVEHLLGALASSGITALTIALDGPEPPILDGSFKPWIDAVREAGTRDLVGTVPILTLRRAIHVSLDDGTHYVVGPAPAFLLTTTIEFPDPRIGTQSGSWTLTPEIFERELASARTFGFRSHAEALQARGRALGSGLDNTVVLDESGVMNPDGLRFPDEFVRHKAADVVGDLSLLGMRLAGHVIAHRPSHSGNIALGRALLEEFRRDPNGEPIVDVVKIMQYLPHRYPMLLVDRITHFETGKRIVGIKNVTINEPFFQGHYPGHPIMPGVLIIEAMAQAGGLLLMDSIEEPEDKVVYFMCLDQVKWRRPVTPGDQLVFELELLQFRRGICRMRGEAFVGEHLVAEAELMARVVDR
jgi:UDP-3-O-[3-hydroxymyristoyl] N-acetylglucosamine deacetylase/3-hydroxyacyl-[acyl-carrier-protein] dehydratase